jgi:hypothetical protein
MEYKYSKTRILFTITELSKTANNVAKKLTSCLEYIALCLGHMQHNTSEYRVPYILKHGGGCIML